MASPAAILNILVTANTTQATAALAKTEAQMQAVSGSAGTGAAGVSKFGKAAKLGGLAAAAGIAVAAKGAYDLGKNFDDAYDTIQTQTGKSGKALDRLKKDFKSVLVAVPSSFADTAQAVGQLNERLDITGKPLRRLSIQMLDLSRITKTDLGDNIQQVTRLFGDWGVATKDQGKTLDGLFRLSQKTGIEVSDLAENLVKFGSPLRQLGFHLDEAAAMFSRFEREGVNTQTLLPGLRFAIKAFSGATAATTVDLKKWGISLTDPQKALGQIMEMIKRAPTDLKANAIAFEVFGQRAGPDMAAAIREGRFSLGELIETFNKGPGTIRGTAKATDDASENFKKLGHSLAVIVEPAATAFYNFIGKIALALSKVKLKDLQHDLGLTKTDLKAVGQAFKVLGEILGVVFSGMLRSLRGFLQGFRGAVVVIRGIVKLIGAILRGDFGEAWKQVKNIFRGGVQSVLGMTRAATGPLREIASRIGDAMGDRFGGAWDRIKEAFASGVGAVKKLMRAMAGAVLNSAKSIISVFVSIGSAIRSVAKWIINAVNNIVGAFGKLKDKVPSIDLPDLPSVSLPGPFQRGGPIDMGKMSGDSVPALLERGEYVLNRNAVGKIGKRNLDAINFDTAPRFAKGGSIPAIHIGGSGAPRAITQGATDMMRTAANAFIKTHRPSPGPGGVKGPKGIGTYAGMPMANWVIESLKYAASRGIAPTPTSGYRSHAENVAAGRNYYSEHEGTQYPHGAVDFGGYNTGLAAKMSVVRATAGFKYPLLAPIGFHDEGHASGTGHQRGGLIGRALRGFQRGGPVDWRKIFGTSFSADEMATLAYWAGAKSPGLMSQIGMGESSGNPFAVGDGGDSIGLWQIDTAFHPQYSKSWLRNPLHNAKAMQAIQASEGIGAWHAAPTGAKGRVVPSLLAALRGKGGGSAAGGGGSAAPDYQKGLGSGYPALLDPFGPLPQTLRACGVELRLRRGQLRQVENALKSASGEERKNLNAMATRLKRRIKVLIAWRNRLVLRHHRKITKTITRVGQMLRQQGAIRSYEDRIGILDEGIRKMLALEPESPTSSYIAGESSLYDEDIGQMFGLRNYLIYAQGMGRIQAGELKGQIARTQKNPKQRWRVPALKAARQNILGTLIPEWESRLLVLQGPGGSHMTLPNLPALGVLGGSIFDRQLEQRDLGLKAGATADNSELTGLLKELLTQANQRFAVSQAQYGVLSAPYGGSFATGGVVPGPMGAPRIIEAHGGETVTPAGAPVVEINFANGMQWLERFIEIKVNGQARRSGRGLPGRGGGGVKV